MCDKIAYKRLQYTHQGRKIYEWEQSLEELHVFIELPPGVTAKAIACDIKAASMTLGLKGNPPFLSESFESSVDSSDSYWTVEDGSLLHIILTCAACQPLHSS